jgi:hypothetical protein
MNMTMLDGTKMTQDKIKNQGKDATSSPNIDVMVKSKELLVMKTLEKKKGDDGEETQREGSKMEHAPGRYQAQGQLGGEESKCRGEPGHGRAHCGEECDYDDESGRDG